MKINRYNIHELRSALDSHSIILVPNHRIRDAILEAHANKAASRTWVTANVYAIDIWIKQLWLSAANQGLAPFSTHRILRRIEEQFIWTSLIEKSLDRIPLLNPDETAKETNRAYQLLRLWLNEEASATLSHYSGTRDVKAFLNWKEQYESYCEEHGLIGLVDCTRILTDCLDLFTPQFSETIVLADFVHPPPLYQRLFKALEAKADVIRISCKNSDTTPSRIRYEFTNSRNEIKACADWARSKIASNPNCHIGIICNDDQSHKSQFERLFTTFYNRDTFPRLSYSDNLFNSPSSGKRLVDAALISHALMLLNLNNEQQNSNDFCSLLQSPYITEFEQEIESRIQLEACLREKLSAVCSVTELTRLMNMEERGYHCPSLAAAILKNRTAFRAARKYGSSVDWATLFANQLYTYGWPGEDLTSCDADLVLQWHESLAQFATASISMGKMNFQTALSRLRTLLADTFQSAHYDGKRQLSLFTIKEAVGLHFDHAWFLGLDEQSFSPSANISPFLPYSLQKEAGVPGSNGNADFEVSRKEFELVCASVTDSIITSYHINDGDQQLRPSSIITPIDQAETPECAPQAIAEFAIKRSAKAELIWSSDSGSVPLQEGEIPRGGQAIITNQSKCPFRAFATHRLHARPPKEFESGLSAMARGSAVHIALEHLFEKIDSLSILLVTGLDQQNAIVKASASRAIEYLANRHKDIMTPRYRKIEQQRIESLLSRFLELERQRGDYTVIARERSIRWQHDQLTVNLKIDRIDKLMDGSVVVIDYKTGTSTTSTQRLLDARPPEMQLPVYYTVVSEQAEETVGAVTIAHINVEKTDFSGIALADNVHPSLKPFDQAGSSHIDWKYLTSSWVEKTHSFAQEFVDGKCHVAPVNRAISCQYCHLEALCRIQELENHLLELESSGEQA